MLKTVLLFFFFVASFSTPSSNQKFSYVHSGGGNPSGYATSSYNGSTDSSVLNLLGLGIFEVMLADLVGRQSTPDIQYPSGTGGSWYSTDDGIINLSIIYGLNQVQTFDPAYLNSAPITSQFVNESVEFQTIINALVITHNKAIYLIELFKCGTSNISSHSNCANFTELGGTETAYVAALFAYAKLTTVRFFQASIELLGRGFYVDTNQYTSGSVVVQTLTDYWNDKGGAPPTYSASASPAQLDATALDYSLSMRPNVTLIDVPFTLLNTSSCRSQYPNQTINPSAFTNRIYNMVRTLAQPWHSKIRPEYAALAAAQDAKASALNISTYGQLLTALGLSSSGHPNPNANPLLGGLLDTNVSNYVVQNQNSAPGGGTPTSSGGPNSGGAVPNLPKAIFAATFQRAHDSIVADPTGLFSGDNDIYDVLVDANEVPEYHCWADPSLGYWGCNHQANYAYAVLTADITYIIPGWTEGNYFYSIREDSVFLHYDVLTVWFFNMYDRGLLEIQPIFIEPYKNTPVQSFLNLGFTTCFPDLVYTGGRGASATSCGYCTCTNQVYCQI